MTLLGECQTLDLQRPLFFVLFTVCVCLVENILHNSPNSILLSETDTEMQYENNPADLLFKTANKGGRQKSTFEIVDEFTAF